MKKIIYFIIATLLFSCNSEKKPQNDLINQDNNNVEIKTPEIKGDTSFVDFFEKFMWDKAYQKSRLLFPIVFNGKEFKNSEKWKHLPFYTQDAYIPTMTSDTLSIFDKDIKLESLKMFILDFKKQTAESFTFKKANKKWHLKNAEEASFNRLPDVEFINFLTKFSTDSVFQNKSISFPIVEHYADAENNYENAQRTIKQEYWKFWKLTDELHHLLILTDIQEENKYRNIFFRGVENGIWVKYTFERINGNWILIKLEDHST